MFQIRQILNFDKDNFKDDKMLFLEAIQTNLALIYIF